MNGRSASAPLTVAAALCYEPLQEARVVAGKSGLSRPVASVAVLDPGDLDAVRRRQLVFVNAYALLGTDVAAIVKGLAAREASGFGVKLDPYWASMPEPLIRSADELELPLLELPPGRFGDIINPLLSAIVDRQAAVLGTTADLHRKLTEGALGDEGVGSAARIVSDALDLDVAIFDDNAELLAAAGTGGEWPDGIAAAALEASAAGPLEHGDEVYLVAPISATGERYGTVCARGAPSDDAVARAAIVEAAVVTGMQLLARRHVEGVHRRFEHDLLEDLVAGRLTAREARERGERVGWPARRPYMALLAARRARRTVASGPPSHEPLCHDDQLAFMRAVRPMGRRVRPFTHEGCIACIVHLTRGDDPAAAAEEVANQLARARGVEWAVEQLVVAASPPMRDIAAVPAAVRHARLTLAMSSALRQRGRRVAHFDGLGPARLLAKSHDRARLEEMARAELGPLAQSEPPELPALLETLAVLLAYNMRIVPAAGELFFHYNSVRHRLGRLRELFGDRLDTPDGQLSLWLAIVALRVTEVDRVTRRSAELVA
jgi:purine catabolism regulator